MSEYLFLYGTLLPTEAAEEIAHVVRRFHHVGSASVPGRLYDFGDYPGAVLDPSSPTSICGELVALPTDETLLGELDRYEEFQPANPEASLFIRKKTKVMVTDGRSFEAWIYVLNRDPGDAPIVRGGDYSKSKVASV